MISKVITGKSFYGCCRYICEDKSRAVVLKTEGVRNYSFKLMANDFEMNRKQLPSKRTAVFHGILSFYPGESLTDDYVNRVRKLLII